MNKIHVKATYITANTQGIPFEYTVKFEMPIWDNMDTDYYAAYGTELPEDDDWIAAMINKGRKQVLKELGGTAFWDLEYVEIFLF